MNRALVCSLAVVGLVFCSTAASYADDGQKDDKAKKNEAKLREKEKERAEKDARRYEKLKTFALNLYQTNLDFREEVDDHFDQVQRDHSEKAFEKNIATPARPTLVHDGDRLRLQTGLYDNKLVSDYINRVGQRLVPADSDKLFAFRLVAHPIPFAETLSTGTIYISTGLVSMLDNEAQLAYVLAHEMAHVHLDHWRLKSTLSLAEDESIEKEGAKRRLWGLGIGAVAGVLGAKAVGGGGAAMAQAGLVGAVVGQAIAARWGEALSLNWDTVQENEADKMAFDVIRGQTYDIREVPKLYATLQRSVKQDQRVGLAFIGNRRRTTERLATAEEMVAQAGAAASSEVRPVLTHPDFVRVMATLRRDNGILSFYRDMFQLAKSNLEYARTNRPDDPSAHYYYGKVMKLVGRTDDDRRAADEAFLTAVKFDWRERNYGAHLYRALALIDKKDASLKAEIAKELQLYLESSMRFNSTEAALANALPANLDDMYDFLTDAGEPLWRLSVPDSLAAALAQVGTSRQKTESPLNELPVAPTVTPTTGARAPRTRK